MARRDRRERREASVARRTLLRHEYRVKHEVKPFVPATLAAWPGGTTTEVVTAKPWDEP